MAAIILGNPTDVPIGSVIPVSVPAYEAEEAVIVLSDGYNPYIIGSGSGTSIIIQNDYVRYFTISDAITDVLYVSTGTITSVRSLTVNGVEFYESIDFTKSGGTITFTDYLPYDSIIGNTVVRVVYTLLPTSTVASTLSILTDASLVPLDTTNFDGTLDATTTNVQILADLIDDLPITQVTRGFSLNDSATTAMDYYSANTSITTINIRNINTLEYSTDGLVYTALTLPGDLPLSVSAGDLYWRITYTFGTTQAFLEIIGTRT